MLDGSDGRICYKKYEGLSLIVFIYFVNHDVVTCSRLVGAVAGPCTTSFFVRRRQCGFRFTGALHLAWCDLTSSIN